MPRQFGLTMNLSRRPWADSQVALYCQNSLSRTPLQNGVSEGFSGGACLVFGAPGAGTEGEAGAGCPFFIASLGRTKAAVAAFFATAVALAAVSDRNLETASEYARNASSSM